RSRARWVRVDSFEQLDVGSYEFLVGTFWKTVGEAYEIAGVHAVHLCQGYEGSFTVYQPIKAEIDAAYRLPIPKITVSRHLVDVCRQFHPDAEYVGQIVDDDFYQPHTPATGPPRVLLVGPAQADFKGIDIGYDAVRRARSKGAEFDLIRASQWDPAADEPVSLSAEFHVGRDTAGMVRLFATAHLFLGSSRWPEGFGLPAAEAMASGVPTILTSIPSFRSWNPAMDHARFVAEEDGKGMGDALVDLLDDPAERARLSAKGREVVEQFRGPLTGKRLEEYFWGRR
ncbi:MAG TPA: glycosyltransferase family 4 protein, partial [Thermoanaerobaculia bacterium]|nr:glycosyltransferase family 4 protein [Thermoanaerobaculia bacterium]